MNQFLFYTDGATAPTNPGPSSYAWVEIDPNDKRLKLNEYSEFIGHATNNIAEIKAILSVLQHIESNRDKFIIHTGEKNIIDIYTDSTYAMNAITFGYMQWVSKRKLHKMKNVELLHKTVGLYQRLRRECHLNLYWNRGHIGIYGNEEADRLCNVELERNRI